MIKRYFAKLSKYVERWMEMLKFRTIETTEDRFL